MAAGIPARLTPELQRRGIVVEVGGHGYQNFLNAEMPAPEGGGTLFEQHPEYFGADQQGRRRKEHGRAPCTSNPDAVAYLTKNLLAYVQVRPEINIFDLWPPDGRNPTNNGSCRIVASPLIVGETIIAPSRERPLLVLRAGGRGDVTKSHLAWQFNQGPDVPSPVSDGTYL